MDVFGAGALGFGGRFWEGGLGKEELEELETFLDIPNLTTHRLEDLISKGRVDFKVVATQIYFLKWVETTN